MACSALFPSMTKPVQPWQAAVKVARVCIHVSAPPKNRRCRHCNPHVDFFEGDSLEPCQGSQPNPPSDVPDAGSREPVLNVLQRIWEEQKSWQIAEWRSRQLPVDFERALTLKV